MALRVTTITRQPLRGTPRVDRKNPLTRGLVSLVGTATAYDAASEQSVAMVNGSTVVSDRYGQAHRFDGISQSIDFGDVPEQKLVGASLTLMSWFNWDVGASARNAMLISRDSDVGGRGYTFDIEDTTLRNVFRFYVAGGGGGPGVDIVQSPDQAIVAGTDNIAFATNDTSTSTATLYLNGVQVSSGVLTTAIPAATTNTRIGSRAYAGFEGYFAGKIRLSAIWNRVLTADEVARISANPWQLFAAPGRPLIRGALLASSSLTASLATTDAADTLASSFRTSASASLATTDSADTLAASTSISTAASLATTDAIDTLAGAAATRFVASLATTDAIDTLSAAASLAAVASLATTDSIDSLSAAGLLSSNATLAATDAIDVLSASFALGNTIAASLATTDAIDTLAAAGLLSSVASLAVTDAADVLSAAGLLKSNASLAVTDAPDALAASFALAGALAVSLNTTDAPDGLVASAQLVALASLAVTDPADVLAAALSVVGVVSAALAVTDAPDTLSALAFVPLAASLSTTDGIDRLAATFSLPNAAQPIACAHLTLLSRSATLAFVGCPDD